jgi:hypothetical protein
VDELSGSHRQELILPSCRTFRENEAFRGGQDGESPCAAVVQAKWNKVKSCKRQQMADVTIFEELVARAVAFSREHVQS